MIIFAIIYVRKGCEKMEKIKLAIAKNITDLRKQNNITQLELANKLNYTDKAISKWERGESIPDVIVLKNIADLFGVSIDYLLEEEHSKKEIIKQHKDIHRNRKLITSMSMFLFIFLASLVSMVAQLSNLSPTLFWLPYILALPLICIVYLVFNTLWFNKKRNYIIVSFLLWTTLIAIYLTFVSQGHNPWIIFTLGIPGQCIILLWSGIRYKARKNIE